MPTHAEYLANVELRRSLAQCQETLATLGQPEARHGLARMGKRKTDWGDPALARRSNKEKSVFSSPRELKRLPQAADGIHEGMVWGAAH